MPRFYNSSKQFITPATLIATNNTSYWGVTPDTSFNSGWISANCTLLKAQNASDTVAYVRFIFKHGTDDSSFNLDTLKTLTLTLGGTTYKLDGTK